MPMPKPEQQVQQKPSDKVRLNSQFLRGLSPADQEEFRVAYKKAGPVLQKIVEVLTKAIDDGIIKDEDPAVLNSPNALAAISHSMGKRAGIRYAVKLMTSED